MSTIELINSAFNVYRLLLIGRILMSWFPSPSNPTLRSIFEAVYAVTEPFLSIFRRLLPTANLGGMGIDFSPIIAFFVLSIAQNVVIEALAPVFG